MASPWTLVATGVVGGIVAAYGIYEKGIIEGCSPIYQDWKNLNRDGKYHVYDPLVLDLDGDGIETVGTQG